MIFRVLDDHLQALAVAAGKYFTQHHSCTAIRAEAEIEPQVNFRPTLCGSYPDRHLLCVEVGEAPVPPGISNFVLECRNFGIPARIWVAIPKGLKQIDMHDLVFIRDNGLGLIEVSDSGHVQVLEGPPLSQSASGLRRVKVSQFPKRYRAPLASAFDTFVRGNPAKGCSEVYDEIEGLTRRIAKKAMATPGGLRRPPAFDIDKEAWANVLEFLRENLDKAACKCPNLTKPTFNRVLGMTEFRNDAGHKPNTLAKLRERDRQLRTRFESAIDELAVLVRESAKLKP